MTEDDISQFEETLWEMIDGADMSREQYVAFLRDFSYVCRDRAQMTEEEIRRDET